MSERDSSHSRSPFSFKDSLEEAVREREAGSHQQHRSDVMYRARRMVNCPGIKAKEREGERMIRVRE